MAIFVFCPFTALFHKTMEMKKTLTFMICCILILEVTGRIERPRGVALSSKYRKCSATLALVPC